MNSFFPHTPQPSSHIHKKTKKKRIFKEHKTQSRDREVAIRLFFSVVLQKDSCICEEIFMYNACMTLLTTTFSRKESEKFFNMVLWNAIRVKYQLGGGVLPEIF